MTEPVTQLRIYRIRSGLMAEWLDLFTATIVPLHSLVGLSVSAAWINPQDPDEFVWTREFDSLDSVEAQEAQFFSTPERQSLGDVRGRYVETFEVRLLHPVTAVPPTHKHMDFSSLPSEDRGPA